MDRALGNWKTIYLFQLNEPQGGGGGGDVDTYMTFKREVRYIVVIFHR